MTLPTRGLGGRAILGTAFIAVLTIVSWIVLSPLAIVIFSSLSSSQPSIFNLANYGQMISDPLTWRLLGSTLVFALGSMAMGVGIAILIAWLVERTDLWGRSFIFVAMLAPMAIPSMIYAVSWIQLLAPNNGLINSVLRTLGLDILTVNVHSLGGMIFVQGVSLASHAYLLVAAAFRMLHSTWEEQSAVCGKRTRSTLFRVTLPVLKPALSAATFFYLVVAMETFDIPLTLGLTAHINVISTQIYVLIFPDTGEPANYGLASAFSALLLLIAFVLMAIYSRQIRHAASFVTITGRGYKPRRIGLGAWRLPISILCFAYIAVAVGLPLFILIWRSLLPFYMAPSAQAFKLVNLSAYYHVFENAELGLALRNTFIISLAAGFGTVLLAAAIAWFSTRSPFSAAARRTLHWLAFIPQAMPGVVIALAMILIYLRIPVPIYGTVWIIALAMTTKYLAFNTATMVASQMQISRDLEDASSIAGARPLRTYFRIVGPLIAPALANCFLWVVIHVVRDLGMSLMLYSNQSQTVSTQLWSLWTFSRVDQVCAIGTITTVALVFVLALIGLVARLRLSVQRARADWSATSNSHYRSN